MKVFKLAAGAILCALVPLSTPASAATMTAGDLHTTMRKLWTDHVVWTRDYIIAAIGDEPDAEAALTRLMKNQDDIGAAVAHFYGDAAGQQLTTLLKEHIAIAGELITDAKAGDKAAQQQASGRWQENAADR